jgi:hypothetical protein
LPLEDREVLLRDLQGSMVIRELSVADQVSGILSVREIVRLLLRVVSMGGVPEELSPWEHGISSREED